MGVRVAEGDKQIIVGIVVDEVAESFDRRAWSSRAAAELWHEPYNEFWCGHG